MAKNLKNWHFVLVMLLCTITNSAHSQFTLTGQLRTRTEVRNGFGNLVLNGSKSAAFTSQRTRLLFGYTMDRLVCGLSIQDVRIWGQDASSISNADGNKLMVHEAWVGLVLANKADSNIKFKLVDMMTLKVGRQELIYDDSRLIGNLDWLQQARRFDMALLKTMHKGWQVDIGYAFNQNTDAFGVTGTAYIPANLPAYVKNSLGNLVPTPAGMITLAAGGNAANASTKTGTPVFLNPPNTNAGTQDYKSFTSIYISRLFAQTKFSGLFFNDHFGKYKLDSVGNKTDGYTYGRRFVSAGKSDEFDYSGTYSRYTYGLMINNTLGNGTGFGKLAIQAAYYAQSGKDRDGISMKNAYHYTISAAWQKGKITVMPGYDVLSGNNSATAQDEKFDPLYGTPHKFWGYMDYFYAGTGSAAGGLNNPFVKVKYTNNALTLGIDYHHFSLNKDMTKADGTFIGRNLGNEIDLGMNYTISRIANIELGYSTMFATSNMAIAKGQAVTDAAADNYRKTGNWFYASLKFTPDFLYKKPAKDK